MPKTIKQLREERAAGEALEHITYQESIANALKLMDMEFMLLDPPYVLLDMKYAIMETPYLSPRFMWVGGVYTGDPANPVESTESQAMPAKRDFRGSDNEYWDVMRALLLELCDDIDRIAEREREATEDAGP